jgi:hypothetical protein
MFGPSKKVVNNYLGSIVRGKSLVLDTRELGTSKALAKNNKKKNITVFGIDPQLAKKCKRFGVACVPGWSGDVLDRLKKQKYDFIYLDYCGTPDGSADFDPMDDMEKASTMLKRGGVLAVTFCKRCTSIVSKCVNMCPDNLYLRRAFEYCDTSPMIFVAYASKKLPRVGPPVGSVVKVVVNGRRERGVVEEVFLDGVRLTHVDKNGKSLSEEHWEEPFNAILY